MKKTINMETISKVAKFLELKEIYLLKSKSNLINENLLNNQDKKIAVVYGFNAYTTELVSKKKAKILANFEIKIHNSDNFDAPDKDIAFFIEASFILLYSISKNADFSKDDLDMFAGVNGVFNCWPYWREFVQSITARMGIPPLTIPLFKIPKQSISKKKGD